MDKPDWTELARADLDRRDPRIAAVYDEWLKTDRTASARALSRRLRARRCKWTPAHNTCSRYLKIIEATEKLYAPS